MQSDERGQSQLQVRCVCVCARTSQSAMCALVGRGFDGVLVGL